jgi:Malonyl-CoA decarboxylase (MCD).
MPERSFLAEMLQRIAGRGGRKSSKQPTDLCRELLDDKGGVSGLVTAINILDTFEAMTPDQKTRFFQDTATDFSVDDKALETAIANWTPGNDAAARQVHSAAEPKSQELIRRLNRVPGATARLVNMRADLLGILAKNPELSGLNIDFQHLFRSWFNRGFLEMRRMNWSTPANILEKIITYEAVHEITGWDDLRQRVAIPDRRLFAFFHPAMPSDPLIFVEVALTSSIPGAIGPILAKNRKTVDPPAPKLRYSIRSRTVRAGCAAFLSATS